jgi:hypothetical protein
MPLKMKKFKTIKIYNVDCSACGLVLLNFESSKGVKEGVRK